MISNCLQLVVTGLLFFAASGCTVAKHQIIDDVGGTDDSDNDSGIPVPPERVLLRPLSDISDSPLTVTDFAPDGTARLQIATTVAVICNVVYGRTPAFGYLSQDPKALNGPCPFHNLLLNNLEPGLEYCFRVQGVDANGIVYVSETVIFRVPPPR